MPSSCSETHDPAPVRRSRTDGHVLISESAYGDRLHEPIEAMEDELWAVIDRVAARGGKVIIPSFALERAQDVIYALERLCDQGRMPKIPVFVDSPLTVKVTDIFRLHPECYDAEARALLRSRSSPFEFEGLRYISDVEDSKAIDASPEPADGFQAQHTLGRRIVERRPRIRIFGVERDLRAEVAVLNGFSAHADQRELIEIAEAVRERGLLQHTFLVHGEPAAQRALAAALVDRGFPRVGCPAPAEVVTV